MGKIDLPLVKQTAWNRRLHHAWSLHSGSFQQPRHTAAPQQRLHTCQAHDRPAKPTPRSGRMIITRAAVYRSCQCDTKNTHTHTFIHVHHVLDWQYIWTHWFKSFKICRKFSDSEQQIQSYWQQWYLRQLRGRNITIQCYSWEEGILQYSATAERKEYYNTVLQLRGNE